MHQKEQTQNSEFPGLVKKNFNFLFREYGFSVTSEQYTGFPYAEWIIVLSSSDLFVQISLDKAQVAVNVGAPNVKDEPIDLMFALMYITGNNEWNYLRPGGNINAEYYDKQMKHLSKIMHENFVKIKHFIDEFVNSSNVRRRYKKFVKDYYKNKFGY